MNSNAKGGFRLDYYSDEELKGLGFKSVGKNVQISSNCSIYTPENISVGNHVRIDDFCVLSGGQKGIDIGSYVHIAVFCAIYGNAGVTIKDFCGISSRSVLYSANDDYSGISLIGPTIPEKYRNVSQGQIILNKHVIIGTNSTIFPKVSVGEGSAIGAYSLVEKDLEPWGIYVGVPVKKLKDRKKDLLEMERQL
jgi:acetyltransferase-like isoleucine patch superfamily enzyme